MTIKRSITPIKVVSATLVASVLSLSVCTASAFAADISELALRFENATKLYEDSVVHQQQNAEEIVALEAEIQKNEGELQVNQEDYNTTAVALYKSEMDDDKLLDFLLDSESFSEVVMRYDTYMKIKDYYVDQLTTLRAQREELQAERTTLENEKQRIEQEVSNAKQALEEAEQDLKNARHEDGAKYHQRQGVSNNCGATAFIVGVNILLNENKYTDNVAVWKGAGFKGNSTVNLSSKGATWLAAHDLSDTISIESVSGDIKTTEQMKSELEEGHVIVTSTGGSSIWQYADGTHSKGNPHPDGHWIVFYYYKDGKFYANDSAQTKKKGAGCVYTTEEMEQWLKGRGNHFATVMKRID